MSRHAYDPDWLDLESRLREAERRLRDMATERRDHDDPTQYNRLTAKRAGVALARSYVEEYLR